MTRHSYLNPAAWQACPTMGKRCAMVMPAVRRADHSKRMGKGSGRI